LAAIKLVSDSILAGIFPSYNAGALAAVSASLTSFISEYCNTTFEEIDYTNETHDYNSPLILNHMPITEVTSIVYTDTITLEETELVSGTDFFVYPDRIELISSPGTRRSLTIDYSAGIVTIPETIKKVAERLAKYWAFEETEGTLGFYKRQSMDDRSYEAMTDQEARILSPLRKWIQRSTSGITRGSIKVGVI
jgi:hypothetical protein